jgi:hypothetical protein
MVLISLPEISWCSLTNSKHGVVEKRKNATAKSQKSRCYNGRCCKVDAIKVKGLPGGGLFDIGVYIFPAMQGRYLCPEEKPDS